MVAIMIVAMGVTIFNKARGSADTTALDSTEITMFNQKFERFSGTQKGSNVKSLLSFAISNASTNKDEPSKLPTFKYQLNKNQYGVYTFNGNTTAGQSASNDIQSYIDQLSNIRNNINSTHQYTVNIKYSTSGLINIIEIVE